MSASPLTDKAPRPLDSAVLMVGQHYFITGLEMERARHDIHAVCGIGHKDDVVWLRPQIGSQCLAGFAEQPIEAASQKFHRLGGQFALPALIGLKDWAWTGAKTSMIEKSDLGAQEIISPCRSNRCCIVPGNEQIITDSVYKCGPPSSESNHRRLDFLHG